jgi:hypothetical protein
LFRNTRYPFQELEEQLAKYENTTGSGTVTIDSFFFDCLLADLVRSAKELTDARLLHEIDALYSTLESQRTRTAIAQSRCGRELMHRFATRGVCTLQKRSPNMSLQPTALIGKHSARRKSRMLANEGCGSALRWARSRNRLCRPTSMR